MYKLLVVENDQVISSLIVEQLKEWNLNDKGVEHFNAVMDDFLFQCPVFIIFRFCMKACIMQVIRLCLKILLII